MKASVFRADIGLMFENIGRLFLLFSIFWMLNVLGFTDLQASWLCCLRVLELEGKHH